MIDEEQFFARLKARRPDVFKRNHDDRPVVDSTRAVWRGILEEELRQSNDGETIKLLRAELVRSYQQDGYSKDEPKKLLKAAEEGDEEAKRRIIEAKVSEFAAHENFSYAADELQALGEWKRSGEMWLRQAKQSTSGNEFVFAAESFVRAGEGYRKANLRIARVLKRRIASMKAAPGWMISSVYWGHLNELGHLLEKGGRHEKALAAYQEAVTSDDYEKRRIAARFWERVGNWKKAIKAQQKFMDSQAPPSQDEFLKLAELRARVGDWKGYAIARWGAGDFLHAASTAFELRGKKKYFKRAAEAYLKQPFGTTRDFFTSVWHLAEDAVNTGDVGKALLLLHAAHNLPEPPSQVEKLSPQEHWARAAELSKQFGQRRKATGRSKLAALMSEGLHSRAFLHAAQSDKANQLDFFSEIKRIFKGLPRPRRPVGQLPPELAEAYAGAAGTQQWMYGGDPLEMAGRCYEEGGFFKEAHDAYKKAELRADAERVKALIPAKPRTRGK